MIRLASATLLHLVILMPLSGFGGEIYKCVSADGSVTFADRPCMTSAEEGEAQVISDVDSTLSFYSSEWDDSYQARQQNADKISSQKRATHSVGRVLDCIDIPPMPHPPAPPPPPPPPSNIGTDIRSGTPVLIIGQTSGIDLTTGKIVSGQVIGPYPEPNRLEQQREYLEQKREYAEKKRQRDIAIEAERHRAETQRTNASPLLCADYRLQISSLENQIQSRPDSRASAETRSRHFYQQKANKEKLRELKKFTRSHCDIAIEPERHCAETQRTNASPLICADYRLQISSLENQIHSRPDSRASAVTRSRHFYQQKANKKKLWELKSFTRSHCQ